MNEVHRVNTAYDFVLSILIGKLMQRLKDVLRILSLIWAMNLCFDIMINRVEFISNPKHYIFINCVAFLETQKQYFH